MTYFSWEEESAYRKGREDARYGRHDYDYDEHFGGDIDKAYYDGIREQEYEDERRREMYEDELRIEEERRREEQYLRMREMEEEEYYDQMGPQQEYPEDDLPF